MVKNNARRVGKKPPSKQLQALRKQRTQKAPMQNLVGDDGELRRAPYISQSSKDWIVDQAIKKGKARRKAEAEAREERRNKDRERSRRHQRMKDMPAITNVVGGGLPGMGKSRKH